VATLQASGSSRRIEGWGEVIDPAGDSRVTAQENRLVIDVPGGVHDLSVEIGQVTAPRLLQPVEGDFVAEVSVTSPFRPGTESAIPDHRLAFNGTGLLLWIDGGNYVRLEAAALADSRGTRRVYPLFQLRTRGQMHDFGRGGGISEGSPIRLRIERSDSGLRAYYQRSGSEWKRAGEIRGTFPRRLQVGVAAVSTSRSPFRAELEDFRVEPAPRAAGAAASGVPPSTLRPSPSPASGPSPRPR
jgi:regulation of enolase protein 1 (concanavalin A-like superfamily)